MEVTRLFDLLPFHKASFKPKNDVVTGKEDGKWVGYSIDQFIDTSENISYGLMKLGIGPGDKIATIANNRPEWNFLDMAILQIGAIHVPIYPTISESDYKYILKHSDVKYVFVAGKELLKKIVHIVPEIDNIKGLYTFKPTDDIPHLNELIELGKKNPQAGKLQSLKDSVNPDDTATLIYTSGTTGNPKGVLLSHNNILSNVFDFYHIFPVDETCKGVSYLPLCHVYERTNIYIYLYLGLSVYYAENMGTIGDNIREVQPEIFTTVPRLLEKVYDRIVAKGRKLTGIKKQLFFWAVNLGDKYEVSGKSVFYKMQLSIANKLIFNKWRDALGGNLRCIVSGGAAIQPRLIRVFNAAKIPVLEGYGLTETSPVISVNTFEPGGMKIGTVGKPSKSVEVLIAEDGEICIKGPMVMQGYYKEPALTADAIDKDGWFHTGDMGKIEDTGHLKITGRKKEIFKTSLGKYISPQLIENKFKESPFIDNIVVLGENQKFAAALIVPDFAHLKSWCAIKKIKYTNNAEIINNPEILARLRTEINEYNQHFGSTEKIQKFDMLDHEFSIETGELTANLKVKRGFICEKYRDRIDKLFA